VVDWILARCEDKVDAVKTAIGYVPKPEDINIEGLDITLDTVKGLLSVDRQSWLDDVSNIRDFYALVGDRVPAELHKELNELEARLKA
ncbi:MAG: phosphoenolpyruvate carboxykinase (GTP), partial [Clostridia bacterium]|nr:phosphoenolpyruvate carboxykinase (GTP) [Clostridia bacterium]